MPDEIKAGICRALNAFDAEDHNNPHLPSTNKKKRDYANSLFGLEKEYAFDWIRLQ